MLEKKEYLSVKGYDWFVQNHELYSTELNEHYLKLQCISYWVVFIPIACCLFMNSCLKHLHILLTDPVCQYFLSESVPLAISLLPVDLVCSCVRIALQLESIPCEVVAGLFWLSNMVVGDTTHQQDEMLPFCSSQCLNVLRCCFQKEGYADIVMSLLQGPVFREIQLVEKILSNDPVLLHPCEMEADSPGVCMIVV